MTKIEKPIQVSTPPKTDVPEIENCQIQKTDWIFASTLKLPQRDKPLEVHFFRAIHYLWAHNKLQGLTGLLGGLWNWKALFQECWEDAHKISSENIQTPKPTIQHETSVSDSSAVSNLQKLGFTLEKAKQIWNTISETELSKNQQYLEREVEGVKVILYKKEDGSLRRYVWTHKTKLGEGVTKIGMKAIELTTGKCRVIFEMNSTLGEGVALKDQQLNFKQALKREEEIKPLLKKGNVPFVCKVKKVFSPKNKDRPVFFTYCDSGSLASRIKKGLNEERKLEYATQLLEFLAALHQAKIVHRDLKPDNILLHKGDKKEPELMVADFEMWEKSSTTKTTGCAGTPEYCSIELNSAFNDENSAIYPEPYHDLWAAGVTLYELQTGKLPVSKKTCQELQKASEFPEKPAFKKALSQYRKELQESLNSLKNTPIEQAIKSLLVEKKEEQPSASNILQTLKVTNPSVVG